MSDADSPKPREEKRGRSPSFPFIPLKKAIERAETIAKHFKRYSTRTIDIASKWDYRQKSSGHLQTLAALKAYGLIDYFDSGRDRKVKLTGLAWRLLFDQRPGERERARREAGRKPILIAEYLERWRDGRPDDSHCISELTFDRGFTTEAAKNFLSVFDETKSFANLGDSDKIVEQDEDENFEGGIIEDEMTDLQQASEHDVVPKKANQYKVLFLGDRLQVSASVDKAGLRKLMKILEAQEALLEDGGEIGQE